MKHTLLGTLTGYRCLRLHVIRTTWAPTIESMDAPAEPAMLSGWLMPTVLCLIAVYVAVQYIRLAAA